MKKQFKRSLLLSLSLLFGQGIMAESLSQLCLRSFEKVEKKANIEVEVTAQGLKKITKLEPPKLSERQMLESLLKMSDVKVSPELVDSVVDLEMLFSQGENINVHLMNILSRNNMTMFGYAQMARILTSESDDLDGITGRQEIIRTLLEDEALYNKLTRMFDDLKQQESNILSFWQEQDALVQGMFDECYFQWAPESMNKSTAGMELRYRTFNGLTGLAVGGLPGMIAGGLGYACYKFGTNKVVKTAGEIVSNSPEMFTAVKKQVGAGQLALGLGSLALYAGLYVYSVKIALEQARQVRDLANYMQGQLVGVAHVVHGCNMIDKLASRHSELQDGLQHISCLQQRHSSEFRSLRKKLQTNTFEGEPSFFSVTGRVRAAHKLMVQTKDEFVGMFQLLGELEVCLAIATKMKEVNAGGTEAQMCFVEFSQSKKPYLGLQNFWNPFVDIEKAVPNSIEFGRKGANRNALLTGSNTGGKSTTIKGIMHSVWLARFGVAFASRAIMTPFTLLSTSLNIKDDTAAGKSLFKSEVLRAKSIDQQLQKLNPNEFGFVVIDELFVGTSSQVGEKAAYQFAKQIAEKYPNVLIGFVTHFGKLTELEKDTNGVYKNFKQEIYKDASGRLVRPFKLEAGISTHNVAEDILNEDIADIDFMCAS